jgi:hypothetical protein
MSAKTVVVIFHRVTNNLFFFFTCQRWLGIKTRQQRRRPPPITLVEQMQNECVGQQRGQQHIVNLHIFYIIYSIFQQTTQN